MAASFKADEKDRMAEMFEKLARAMMLDMLVLVIDWSGMFIPVNCIGNRPGFANVQVPYFNRRSRGWPDSD
jgi:hypothetical protein